MGLGGNNGLSVCVNTSGRWWWVGQMMECSTEMERSRDWLNYGSGRCRWIWGVRGQLGEEVDSGYPHLLTETRLNQKKSAFPVLPIMVCLLDLKGAASSPHLSAVKL